MQNKITKEDYPFLYESAVKLYEKSRTDNSFDDFPMSERRKYYKNGDRNDFEKLYFGRRDYLSATAVLSLFDKGYINELEKIILAVCNEYCWALPAHTVGIKAADKRIIDLFVAETGFVLSEICTVFSDYISDDVTERVRREIKKRLVNNFVLFRFRWERQEMNWAAVCGAYVGGTLLYLFPEAFRKHKKRILRTLGCYINGFTDDGFCLEGPLYWQYGFTAFSAFAELFYRYTDGKENLFSDEKVKKIAAFGSRCLLKGNTAVSFSDADRGFRQDYALQSYLHSLFPERVPSTGQEEPYLYDANTKWMNYYRAYLWSGNDSPFSPVREDEIYSPYANQLIINKDSYSFAFKGGNNGEPHNHNDLGSFIFSDRSGQVFCDLGSGRYTKDYFDDNKRYGIFCNSSLGHSVPVIDGKGQCHGEEFSASLSCEKDTAVCDITKAYSCEKLLSLKRKVTFEEKGVIITDSFSFKEKGVITERFISLIKAQEEKGRLIFGSAELLYPVRDVIPSVKEERHTPHEYDTEDITVYCYDFTVKENVSEITFEIKSE